MTEEKLPDQNPPPWVKDYKPKREWVGLTDEEINKLAEQVGMFIDKYGLAFDAKNGLEDGVDVFGFAEAIEAKLKEKNT